ILTTIFINLTVFYLSVIALFVILFYSYTKRFTPLCHLVLGVALALSPIGAYLAVTAYFKILPVLISLIVFTWVSGFDIIYALQDEDFDKAQQLYSIPSVLGKTKALCVSTLLHVTCFGFVLLAGFFGDFHWLYWVGASLFCALLIYQHTLVKPHDLSKVNIAFGNTNGIASIIFATLAIISFIINK